MHLRFLAVPALALAFLGAGCTPAASPAPTNHVPVTDAGSQDGRTLTAVQTDETWKTFENTRVGFSFQYPTKGKYAPEWEVKVFDQNAREVQDCYYVDGASLDDVRNARTTDGRHFCTVHASEGAAESAYFTDAYATAVGKSVVVILFTKKAIMADIGDCVRAPGQNYWSEFAKPGSCVPFSETEYRQILDGIASTFKTKE